MGLPEIFISFQTAAVSAITRSARGVLAVAVKDATAGGAAEAAYKSLAEVPEDKFSPENYRLLKLAFLAAPTKVWVLRVGEEAEKTYQALERLRFDWAGGARSGGREGDVLHQDPPQRRAGCESRGGKRQGSRLRGHREPVRVRPDAGGRRDGGKGLRRPVWRRCWRRCP